MTQTRTIRATVEYDGTGFRGFQRQASTRTVQGALEAAISSSVSASVGIEAAGRTDSGVHALGQGICFSVSSLNLLQLLWGTGGWGQGDDRNHDGVVGVEWGGACVQILIKSKNIIEIIIKKNIFFLKTTKNIKRN